MMKIKGNHITLAIAACFIFSYSHAASAGDTMPHGVPVPPSAADPRDITSVSASAGDLSGLKDILLKMVRQDELLDEAIENLEGADGTVTVQKLTGIKKTLGVVRRNLDHISWLNKKHFTGVEPGSENEKYTRAILSYSDKISRKSARIGAIAARAAAAKNKSALRDAPSSKKTAGSAKAKSVTRILKEKDAWTGISAETRKLKGSSHKLKATSRWLHVASR